MVEWAALLFCTAHSSDCLSFFLTGLNCGTNNEEFKA